MEKTVQVAVMLYAKDVIEIDRIAKERELLRSDILREAVREYVKKNLEEERA